MADLPLYQYLCKSSRVDPAEGKKRVWPIAHFSCHRPDLFPSFRRHAMVVAQCHQPWQSTNPCDFDAEQPAEFVKFVGDMADADRAMMRRAMRVPVVDKLAARQC